MARANFDGAGCATLYVQFRRGLGRRMAEIRRREDRRHRVRRRSGSRCEANAGGCDNRGVKRKDAKSRGRERKESLEDTDRLTAELAAFRYSLRKFLRFSETAARSFGITPQQHQLMLGVAGYTGRGSATVSELAEFLQERLHSVVGLVERAEQRGLIQSRKSEEDRRVVVVSLTPSGRRILRELSELHRQQAASLQLLTGTNSRSSGSG